jgi:hypothetical protein
MVVQAMMQATMLVQTMGDGVVHDITSPSNDMSHKKQP